MIVGNMEATAVTAIVRSYEQSCHGCLLKKKKKNLPSHIVSEKTSSFKTLLRPRSHSKQTCQIAKRPCFLAAVLMEQAGF